MTHLERLSLPRGGALSHKVRFLRKLRVLEGGPGLELPTEIGMVTQLEELRAPHSEVPRSLRNLARLKVLHCRIEGASSEHVGELAALEELRLTCGAGSVVPTLGKLKALQRLAVIAPEPGSVSFGGLVAPATVRELHIEGFRVSADALEALLSRVPDLTTLVLRLEVEPGEVGSVLPPSFYRLSRLASLTLDIPGLAADARERVRAAYPTL